MTELVLCVVEQPVINKKRRFIPPESVILELMMEQEQERFPTET